jgi:hypothetical protein
MTIVCFGNTKSRLDFGSMEHLNFVCYYNSHEAKSNLSYPQIDLGSSQDKKISMRAEGIAISF